VASTIQLQRTISLAQQFVRNAPLVFTGPTDNDLSLSNADWVMQFILSPPFAWRWNRAETNITCIVGQTDYTVSLPTFGWIEKAIINYEANGNQTTELEVATNLAVELNPNQPTKIAAQLDNDSGTITFRVLPAPDQAYVITVTSQGAASLFTALTTTWSPIPDYMSYLFNQGFLAKTYEYLNDSRYPGAMQQFMQMLVSANEGLSESQRNIFIGDRLNTTREQLAVQQGRR
jgi:hypothetical protein